MQFEQRRVRRSREDTLRAPAELVAQRHVCVFRRGEATAERSERDDLLALRMEVFNHGQRRAVVDARVESDLVQEQHVCSDGSTHTDLQW